MLVVFELDRIDVELAVLIDVENKITEPVFELVHKNNKLEFPLIEASFCVFHESLRFLVGKLEEILDFLIGRDTEDFLGVIVENVDEFAEIVGMFPKSGSVVERLGDHRALVGILVELGLDDIQIAVAVDADRVDRTAVGRELPREDEEPDVFLELSERDALRILVDVLLKIILPVEGRLLDRNGLLAVPGNDDGHSFFTLDGFRFEPVRETQSPAPARQAFAHTYPFPDMTVQGLLIRGSVPWTDLRPYPEDFCSLQGLDRFSC